MEGANPLFLSSVQGHPRFTSEMFSRDDALDEALLAPSSAPALPQPWWMRVTRRAWFVIVAGLAIVLAVAVVLVVHFLAQRTSSGGSTTPFAQACSVYCHGPILQAIQEAVLYNDSKSFVDLQLAVDPADALAAFAVAFPDGPGTKEELEVFVLQHFGDSPDTEFWVPSDYDPAPPALDRIGNTTLREFALGLNSLWLQLGRQLSFPREQQARHSLVWQPFPMIVPGGRFAESYYWDTAWVVAGLLRCDMPVTALGVVQNLRHMLDEFGFVPNGGRVYYALPGRSQPPLLSYMVRQLYEATGNASLLEDVYPSLTAEHAWWMQQGPFGHAVVVTAAAPGGGGGDAPHVLNRYVTAQLTPRPESWREDVHTAGEAGFGVDSAQAQALYSEIAAGAETGWDFSSRWFADGVSLESIQTSAVLPVDLNAMLFGVESDLADFAGVLAAEATRWAACAGTAGAADASGSDDRDECMQRRLRPFLRCAAPPPLGAPAEAAQRCGRGEVARLTGEAVAFRAAATARAAAIESLLWDEGSGQWRDLVVVTSGADGGQSVSRSNATSVSNWAPLWSRAFDAANASRVQALVGSLQASGLLQPAGLATTTANTTQQWDAPNGWAPLQHMLVVGLNATGQPGAVALARELARRWVLANLVAYRDTGFMHEKLDVSRVGATGAGGEYAPQVGFGWSNGVVLDLLARFNFTALEE